MGKDPVHNVGRRFTIPLILPLGFGPPRDVHRMVTSSHVLPEKHR